jgi:PAS domain S-box-containing protein
MHLVSIVRRIRAWPLINRLMVAVGLTLVAFVVRTVVLGSLSAVSPYFTFYPAVLLSAVLGGSGAGAVAAILSVALANLFIEGLFENGGVLGVIEFVGSAALIIGIFELAIRSEREETRRKRGERSEIILQKVIEQALVPIAMFDRDMVYLAASTRWLENLGLERSTTIGRSHYHIFPMLPEHWKAAHRRGLSGEVVSGEFDFFDDHDGSSEYFRWQVLPWQGEHGQTAGIIIIGEDLTPRVAAERKLKSSEQRLRLAIEAGNIAIWDWDVASGQSVWNDQHFHFLGYEPGTIEPSYQAWARRVLPEDLDKIEPEIQKALKLGTRYSAQFRVRGHNDKVRWLEACGQVTYTPDGRPERMYGIMWDITEAKTAAAHRELLLAEVNHRAKNLLAVVQSIAHVTAHEGDPKTFAASFNSRIKALAWCQDLLVRSEWRGADLEDLIRSQVGYLDKSQDPRIEIKGPKLQINALAAQTVSMAIHELSTNAIKHGALSCPQGSVVVQWNIDPAAASFRLQWTEMGGLPLVGPMRVGFGTSVLTSDVEHALEADVTLSYPPTGLDYSLSAPLDVIQEKGHETEGLNALAHC